MEEVKSPADIIAVALGYMRCKTGCVLHAGMYCECGRGQAYETLTKLYLKLRAEEKKSPLVAI